MDCTLVRPLLDAYADDELDLAKALEIQEHLLKCQDCSRALNNIRVLRDGIDSPSFYHQAPAALRKRVVESLRSEGLSGAQREGGARRLFSVRPWRLIGFGTAFAALAVWASLLMLKGPGAEELLEQELVSGHARSLMANHLTDVLSTDQHTVKPWFAGRLDFSPQVRDLAQQGFTLVGGRLDYVGGRPVAALIYQHRKHIINVFVWPSTPGQDAGSVTATRQGYNLVRWTSPGMSNWAVSDAAAADLQEFARLMQSGS